MTIEETNALVKVRIDSSRELYNDAYRLYEQGSYKSANNRAYYSAEKSLKALLATKGVDATTHNGVLQLFNRYFIYESNTEFDKSDYQLFASIEIIRSASDYDDFYTASKTDTEEVLRQVYYLNDKVYKYICENYIDIHNTDKQLTGLNQPEKDMERGM